MPVSIERRYTVEEYFTVEESSAIKHEFYEGQIFAMAGASLRHNRITGNIFSALRRALATTGCEVFASDLRVRTAGGLYTYPDVMVVCHGVELSPTDRLDTVVNPTVIVEVLSSSTVAYDRGEKMRLYQACPTLRDYVLVEPSARFVEQFTRPVAAEPTTEWTRTEYTAASRELPLTSLGVSLALDDIYAGVDLM